MGIKIVTDSTCDLSKNLVDQYNIKVVPLKVNFGSDSYADGVDISSEEFFNKLRGVVDLPFTSQVNPSEFEAVFREILDSGDDIVGMFISSTLSGTFNSAVIARESFSDEAQNRIHLFDSRTSTLPLGLMAIEAAKTAEKSNDILKVKERVRYAIGHAKIICMLDTFVYLSKGGRISPGQAMIGNLLNIKPILTINDQAEIVSIDKVRGRKKAIRWIVDYLKDNDIHPKDIPFALIHGDDVGNMELLKEQLGDAYEENIDYELSIGAVIGTHLGPGCIAVAYIE